MPQFAPGETKTAIAPITAKPSGMACEAELFLGPDELTKVATSGKIPFVSTGASQPVSLPITMPLQEGTFKGYIDVFTNGMRFLAYKTAEDIVVAPVIPPPDRYALDGGFAMGYNDNGSWRYMALNYSSKYGYTGIPLLFKAYRSTVQYSLDFDGEFTYALNRAGTITVQKELPASPYPGGGVDYYMYITNHNAFRDMRVWVYLGTPEGGWKHVLTLGQDF